MWQVHPERLHWSNIQLAGECGVSEKQVRAAEQYLPASLLEARGKKRTVIRNGTEYTLAMPSSTKNEDRWQASTPAAAGSERDMTKAMTLALRHAEQAVADLRAAGLNGMPDGVVKAFSYGVRPDVLATKASVADEFAAWLTAAAGALRRKAA